MFYDFLHIFCSFFFHIYVFIFCMLWSNQSLLFSIVYHLFFMFFLFVIGEKRRET